MSLAALVEKGEDRLRMIGVEPAGVLMHPRTLSRIENEIAEFRLNTSDERYERYKSRVRNPEIRGLPIKERKDVPQGDVLVVSDEEWRRHGG